MARTFKEGVVALDPQRGVTPGAVHWTSPCRYQRLRTSSW
jgi:hypothetical protein